ncbi:Helicase MOV-10 [Cladochytrium tenue]|nr:Helicase MOV-10 [Cladochytrium tenue]
MVDDPDQSLFDMDDPFPMDRESFHSTFSTLQYIEELQMAKDIRKYDMEAKIERGGGSFFELNEVELRKQPDRMTTRNNERSFFFLTVPGLAEARPQVLYNDRVFASIKESPEIEYEGRVHDISKETALDLARHLDDEIKFPTIAPSPTHRKILPSPLGDESPGMKELNFEQRMAVRNVVERRHGNVPYIIFGPPGTGKTMTIVECIKQSYLCSKNDPQYGRNHYLVFAPSNLAADQLVERLSDVFPANQMIRVNSYRRPGASVSDKVKQYCPRDSLHGPEMFRLPSAAEVQRYRVVVTTTVSAGLLYAMGIPRGWFTSLFMDEAGQATEPEFWIAVAGLLDASKGQLVLAGYPHAKRFGLNKSYLERLLELPMYTRQQPSGLLDDDDDDGGGADDVGTSRLLPSQRYVHPHAVTRLVRNYRSHPKIMAISSSLFYDRELIAQADLQMRESLADIDMLPTKGFPVVLHAVAGKDEQEGDSPSWFNADEVAVVRKWVMALMALKSKGVTGPQIGVITPYRRQVQKLEASLGRVGVKVATVEEFQGQERRIIIISTVRSSVTHVRHDELHAVGFLRNAKRFNVAVSRAKALLVVVGNPLVLERDAHWGALVRYCRSNGAVVGSDPGGGATAPGLLRHAPSAAGGDGVEGLVTDLTQRLRMAEEGTAEEEELMVQLGENDGSGVGEAQLQEDPAWRRDL